MSIFTDEDLERLRRTVSKTVPHDEPDILKALKVSGLIARLEAAENFILLRGAVIQMERNTRKIETAYSAWRKAAGK